MIPRPAHPPMAPEPLPIQRVQREVRDSFTLHFDVSGRPGGFPFAPGQFNMIYAFGAGEVPISISGDPSRPGELVHTIRAVGAVTQALKKLRRGDVVGLRGPFGQPWPLAENRGLDLLIIGGGLGFAPLRSVVLYALSHREEFGRVALLVGARTPEELLYQRELARWAKDPRLQVLVTADRASPGWTGPVGVVPALIPMAQFDPTRTAAFVCGPEIMMRFTVRELNRRGLPDERISLSMERNMKCALGFCGHCQLGPQFVCKDGPVLRYDKIRWLFSVRQV